MSDFGKYRRHFCECGGVVCRPLHGPIKPCDCCGKVLKESDFTISDRRIDTVEMLRKMRGEKP